VSNAISNSGHFLYNVKEELLLRKPVA